MLLENRFNKYPSQLMRQREEGMTNHLRIFPPPSSLHCNFRYWKSLNCSPIAINLSTAGILPRTLSSSWQRYERENGWLEQVCSDKLEKTVQSMTALWEGSHILLLCSLNNGILSGRITADKEGKRERAVSCLVLFQIIPWLWEGQKNALHSALDIGLKGKHKGIVVDTKEPFQFVPLQWLTLLFCG